MTADILVPIIASVYLGTAFLTSGLWYFLLGRETHQGQWDKTPKPWDTEERVGLTFLTSLIWPVTTVFYLCRLATYLNRKKEVKQFTRCKECFAKIGVADEFCGKCGGDQKSHHPVESLT